ncbi:probable rotamase [Aromatoleum aromaticum EbN1]|uniref:peptidylprolyl isomerase n=1 Tax=Aromatoleum aromaticum (strain DSM 19018 / LMG 30748 / EbN1) TaxID=76114 RepID=Q5P6R8_AROAE|nr:probable rotamase [Aromatoleum aromaticum EbN1]
MPEQGRAELMASEKRLRDFVAQLFAVRKLSDEARARTLDAGERWKIDASMERAAAQVQLDHLVNGQELPDFDKAAREFYVAHPEQFVQPEQVHAQHVLIKSEGRSKEEALVLAKQVVAQANKDSQDFGKLAAEFTEDPSGKANGGDLGFFARGSMVKPFEDAIFGLKSPGEIVGPVESQFGFHVIRLVERKAETTIPFDEVKDKLVRDETLKYRRMAIGKEYGRIGKLPGIEVDQDAIKALVKPLDFKAHARAAEK